MSENLDNIIRQWGQGGGEPSEPPPPRAAGCLTFEQAERIARSAGAADDRLAAHLAECGQCARLVGDFREAIDDAAPRRLGEAPSVETDLSAGPRILGFPLRQAVPAAAAAVVLLGVASLLYLSGRPPASPGDGDMLAAVEVGLQEEIESGMTPKAGRTFTTGQAVMFRAELTRAGRLMLLHVGPAGPISALPPLPSRALTTPLCVPLKAGEHKLGPFRLTGDPGEEAFLLIASRDLVEDLPQRVAKLEESSRTDRDLENMVRIIRAWPAEAKIVRLEHVANPQ